MRIKKLIVILALALILAGCDGVVDIKPVINWGTVCTECHIACAQNEVASCVGCHVISEHPYYDSIFARIKERSLEGSY